LDNDGYSIAVYGIPGEYFKGDPKSLGDPLKKEAVLKRWSEGCKAIERGGLSVGARSGGCLRVSVVHGNHAEGRTRRLRGADRAACFKQTFNLEEMQVEGKSAF
jgi:hypothetical protein